MRKILSALGWATVGALVGFVFCVAVNAISFEISARREHNADLQPGSAWFLGALFGGLAYGPRVGAIGGAIGLVVGWRQATRRNEV